MNKCLSCDNPCAATAVFCESCRALLLSRHKQDKQYEMSFSASLSPAPNDISIDEHSTSLLHSPPLQQKAASVYTPVMHREGREKYSDVPTIPSSVPVASFSPTRRRVSVRRRVMYLVFVVALLIALFVGSIYISHHTISSPSSNAINTPLITAMPTTVHPDMQMLVHLRHFSASTNVYLTHDLQEMVRTDIGTPLIPLGKTGSRDVHIFVDSSWGAGEHTLEAEDVTTRYTITTTIQVIGAGPVRPTRLVVDQATLNMGGDLQGVNSIQSLHLHNSGDGTISWVASSNQPWLLVTPMQGVFSRDEQVLVAVTRANLAPGNNYHGTITIQSSANPPLTVQVTMAVLPLPTHPSLVLEVTPPALSFTAVDGVSNSSVQALTIHNAGMNALSWAFSGMATIADQDTTPPSNTNWLTIVPRTGTVVPGASMVIHLQQASQSLLPGIYNDILIFDSLNGGYDTPQHVAVSLVFRQNISTTSTSSNTPSGTATVSGITATSTTSSEQPVLASLPSQMSFSSTQGQPDPASQNVALTNTGGSVLQWQASIPSSAQSWLAMSSQAGTVASGQTVQVALSVHTAQLATGTYNTQVTVNATNSAGIPVQNSPQLLNVTLTLSAPCTLQVTPSSLTFTATLLQPDPPGQNITLSETGNCLRPISWQASADHAWVVLSNTSGSNGGTITVHIHASSMLPGTYTASITLSAVDKNGSADVGSSPQTVPVTLTVRS